MGNSSHGVLSTKISDLNRKSQQNSRFPWWGILLIVIGGTILIGGIAVGIIAYFRFMKGG